MIKKLQENSQNNVDKCFQYATAVELNHESIGKNPQRIIRNRPFIGQYDWKDINFLSEPKDWEKFEANNKTIALIVLFSADYMKEIKQAYISKQFKTWK